MRVCYLASHSAVQGWGRCLYPASLARLGGIHVPCFLILTGGACTMLPHPDWEVPVPCFLTLGGVPIPHFLTLTGGFLYSASSP